MQSMVIVVYSFVLLFFFRSCDSHAVTLQFQKDDIDFGNDSVDSDNASSSRSPFHSPLEKVRVDSEERVGKERQEELNDESDYIIEDLEQDENDEEDEVYYEEEEEVDEEEEEDEEVEYEDEEEVEYEDEYVYEDELEDEDEEEVEYEDDDEEEELEDEEMEYEDEDVEEDSEELASNRQIVEQIKYGQSMYKREAEEVEKEEEDNSIASMKKGYVGRGHESVINKASPASQSDALLKIQSVEVSISRLSISKQG